jgi:NAD(P)-dependent dehydrogenase (short-subunit alcohol dehydrogenase family)
MTTTLVTGATRGLGREAARRLVLAGHDVYLGARDLARGQQAAQEVGATAIALDVTDEASVAAAVERVRAEVGHLDVLVNNAGIGGEQQPPAQATIADLRQVLETNVIGATSVLRAFTPLLEASTAPVVVNVSSGVGSLTINSRPGTGWSMLAYPMSKAALNMLTIQYARAYPRWRVNAVTPGLTATEFTPSTAAHGHPVEVGAEVLVRMAQLGAEGPTGTFVDVNGPVPW